MPKDNRLIPLYCAVVFYSQDYDGFMAISPDLPGCSAFGQTRIEAITELEDAAIAWMNAADNVGNAIPDFRWKRRANA